MTSPLAIASSVAEPQSEVQPLQRRCIPRRTPPPPSDRGTRQHRPSCALHSPSCRCQTRGECVPGCLRLTKRSLIINVSMGILWWKKAHIVRRCGGARVPRRFAVFWAVPLHQGAVFRQQSPRPPLNRRPTAIRPVERRLARAVHRTHTTGTQPAYRLPGSPANSNSDAERDGGN